MPNFKVIIPARLESTRLPKKPLVDIGGWPMVVKTAFNAMEVVGSENTVVVTPNDEIMVACRDHSVNAILTSNVYLTGSDRIAGTFADSDLDFIINLQGDEPLMPPSDIQNFIDTVKTDPQILWTGVADISTIEEFNDPSIPKFVVGLDNKLLYASRAAIPQNKDLNNICLARKQVCLYSFTTQHLKLLKNSPAKTPLESIEDIEILRFLELGITVNVCELSGNNIAVDTDHDLQRVTELVRRHGF